jgi:hypothetical protein
MGRLASALVCKYLKRFNDGSVTFCFAMCVKRKCKFIKKRFEKYH